MKTTEENNKLIAEFMGARFRNLQNLGLPQFSFNHKTDGNWLNLEELKYHSSWDWLMPVIEKIESIDSLKDQYTTDYCFQATNFIQNYTASIISIDNHIVEAEGETRIEASYYAVVEFIEWHNSQ